MIKVSKDTELKSMIIHVSSKGQVTLPKRVREKLHIQEGDLLRLQRRDNEIIIKRVELATDEKLSDAEWDKLEKLARSKGKTFGNAEGFLKKLKRM